MPPIDQPTPELAALLTGERRIDFLTLTGFLGSGKTTLLNRLLQDARMAGSVILVNEFGAVAIDHLVVHQVTENIVLLRSGCVCCAVREDMVQALRDLYHQVITGQLPPPARVILETTGLADPAPIAQTMMTDSFLLTRYAMKGIITCADAVNGAHQLDAHAEARSQIKLADALVVSKLDLVPGGAIPAELRSRLGALNPKAQIVPADGMAALGLFLEGFAAEASNQFHRWADPSSSGAIGAAHRPHVKTLEVKLEAPVDMDAFSVWLTKVLEAHGPDILRTKGILRAKGRAKPVLINGVHDVFYPPVELDGRAPDKSALLFILDTNAPAEVAEALRRFDPLNATGTLPRPF